ncbi:hypothetical protein [Streptomyces sp. NPDC018693]|uniref:hypothetical protein n=1 Tax=unclassified Streptomyces TaxID=2593676 RepID=UPI0037A08ECC
MATSHTVSLGILAEKRYVVVREGWEMVGDIVVGALVFLAIGMIGAMPALAFLLLFSESLLAFRLSRSGFLSDGICVAHKKNSGKGMAILVEYHHPSAGRTRLEIGPYSGVLPNPGSAVKVHCLEGNPRAAMLSPLPSFVVLRFLATGALALAGVVGSAVFFVVVFG